MHFTGTLGDDILGGTAGNDIFRMNQGGDDTVRGRDGFDLFRFGGTFDHGDRVYGGPSLDAVFLCGGDDVRVGPHTLNGVEGIVLHGGHDYALTFADDPNAHSIMIIAGFLLRADDSVTAICSDVTNHRFAFEGGAGDDFFVGGQRRDFFIGFGGSDTFSGLHGSDVFIYQRPSDSTGLGFDVVRDFNVWHDKFAMPVPVSDVDDPVFGGALTGNKHGHFNASLAAAIGSGELGAQHAVVFLPDAGAWAGHIFLIVDANGEAGFQAHRDFVMELSGKHLAHIDLDNFLGV